MKPTKIKFKEITKGKVAVFIDAANILYSQKTLKWRVDYQKLKSYLEKEVKLFGIFFYTGKVGTFEKQSGFIKRLEKLQIKVIAKEVKFIKVNGQRIPKGNLDVELALDAFRLSDQYQTLMLFSGDSDFSYLLDLLKKKGKREQNILTCVN